MIFVNVSQIPPLNSRITINLARIYFLIIVTHYDVIEEVAEELGWKI